MASKRTTLTVEILTDAAKAQAGMNQAGQAVEGFGSKLSKLAVAAGAGLAIGAAVGKAVTAASDLQQAAGGVDAVFKSAAGSVHSYAQGAAKSLGLSEAAYSSLATVIGSQLKNAGTSMDQLAPKTNDLIATGADLAAMFGGTTAEAVGALSSALKGENDPIEKYGITLNAAAIQAETLALGLDTSTQASAQAAKATATLSLITKQSADAHGAAAREAESFASRQQQLSASFENLLAAAGAPLLGALSSFLDILAGLAGFVTPVAVALGELLGWVLQLPGPLLAAAGALVAWQIVGGLAGITSAFSAAVVTLTAAIKGLSTTSLVGIGLTAAFLAMSALQSIFSTTGDEIEATTTQYDKWLSTLDNGKVTENTRDTIALDSAMSGLFSTYEALGISTQAYVDASTGVEGGAAALQASVQQATNALFRQGAVFGEIAVAASRAGIAQDDMIAAAASGDWTAVTAKMQTYADQQSALTGNTETGITIMAAFSDALAAGKDPATAVANATALAAQTADKFGVSAEQSAQAARALGDGADEAVDPVQQLKDALEAAKNAAEATVVNTFLNGLKTQADDAQRAADFLSGTLDAMTGGTRNLEAAQADMNKALTQNTEAFKGTGEAADLNREALVAWDVQALTTNASGQAVYDSLAQVQAGYSQVVGAAYAAAAASDAGTDASAAAQAQAASAYDAFIGQADAMGLSADQAAALAAQLGILDAEQLDPKVFQLIAEDQTARAKLAELQAQGIDPKDIVVTATVDEATGQIRQVVSAKNETTIVAEGDTAPADAAIGKTEDATYTATVDAEGNTKDAEADIKRVTAATYTATVGVQANASSALQTISNVVNGHYSPVVLSVTANASSALGTIANVVNSSYGAVTISIRADASSFYATYNSLPTSKTVTVNQVAGAQVAAPALAAAPAGLLRATAAPEVGTVKTTTVAAPGGTVINVSGALDPAAVARQIESLLRRSERRSSGVQVRGL